MIAEIFQKTVYIWRCSRWKRLSNFRL